MGPGECVEAGSAQYAMLPSPYQQCLGSGTYVRSAETLLPWPMCVGYRRRLRHMRVRAAGGPRPKVDESLDAASPPSVKTPPASGPSSTTLWAARIVVRSSTSTDRGVFVRAPGLVSRHVRDQGGCVRFARPAAPGRGQVEPDFWPRDNIHGTKLRREYEACSYVGSGRALGRAGGWRGRTMVMMRAWLRPRGRIDSQRERRCSTRARDEMRTRRAM